MRAMLKAAVRRLVEKSGGVEAAALVVERSAAAVSNWQNVNHDCLPNVEQVARLEQHAGEAPVTRYLASVSGYVLSRAFPEPPSACPRGHVGRLCSELGTVAAKVEQSLSDNHLTTAELQDIRRALDRLISAGDKFRDDTHGMEPGPVGNVEPIKRQGG